MHPLQACPPLTVWEEILEGRSQDPATSDYSEHLESCPHCQAVVENFTRGSRTWLDIAAVLRQPFPEWQKTCQIKVEKFKTSVPVPTPQRPETDFSEAIDIGVGRTDSIPRGDNMTARIHIERMMHRSSIAVLGETAATYALVKLIPSGAGGQRPMNLNIALALDVSGSMYEEDGTGISRLQRVQDAAARALEELNPDDTLAVIAFGHNARVLLPSTKVGEKDRIMDIVRKIDMFDVDPGGTAMDEGIALSMSELERISGQPGTIAQMVVLTDGETSGEQNCKILAKKAAEKKINLSLMGVGIDWKEQLIKDLARISNGKWYYIDVNQKGEAERIFVKEFQALAATGFTDVEMHLRPMKDIKLNRVRMVVPDVKDLKMTEPEERHLVAQLGTLQNDQPTRYIVDLTVPKRPDGQYVIAQVEITYDTGTGQRESSGMFPLEITYTAAAHGYVNAEVMKHIDDIQFKEMSDLLNQSLLDNDQEAAQRVAQEIVKKGELIGDRAAKKTKLAREVLQELNAEHRVSRKTQLALDDEARKGEIPS